MTALTAFYPRVMPYCPGVPEPFVDQKALDVVRDFCFRTIALREEVTPIDVVAATHTYTLTPVTANREVLGIIDARYDDNPMFPLSVDRLNLQWPESVARLNQIFASNFPYDGINTDSWETLISTTPRYYYQPTPSQIRLVGIPDTAFTAGLKVLIAIRPSTAAIEVDDWLYARYYEQLAFGIISRLLEMPKKDWTDFAAAAYYKAQYEAAVSKAHGDIIRSFSRNEQAVHRVTAQP